MRYTVARAGVIPELQGLWNGPAWAGVQALSIGRFHPQSSDHRPTTQAKLLHDDAHIYVIFRVRDRYVRSVVTELHGPVCGDSCVEFFLRPRPDSGYFNFEVNAGGTLHVSYIRDWRRLPQGGFADYEFLKPALAEQVPIYHSLPAVVDPEITEPTEWLIEYRIPVKILEHYLGPLDPLSGRQWLANFYKCADLTSHPHWASWSPIGEALDFHLPQFFSPLHFT